MGTLFTCLLAALKQEKVIVKVVWLLTMSPPNRLLCAKFLFCFNFQSASMLLKVCEHVVWVLNSLDPGEMLSYSASHLDPSCLHMAPWLCLTIVCWDTKWHSWKCHLRHFENDNFWQYVLWHSIVHEANSTGWELGYSGGRVLATGGIGVLATGFQVPG